MSSKIYHTTYRQKGRVHSLPDYWDQREPEPYDYEKDEVISSLQGILEDMAADKENLWYRGMLFQMWLEEPNFSELSRQTLIPRTSISQAVGEAIEYIKQQCKILNIKYEL